MDENTLTTLAIAFCLYMIPWIISLFREHPSAGAIFFLNLLLGWSVLGWIWALIWSFSATRQNVVVINPNSGSNSPENDDLTRPL
ncbi:MAG: hypothetical protein CME93_01065 [Hyphomonadaceae bacterium]|nr:hypothetical protein [Hyphomonadaceae bacterium]OUX95701.1 MAG: hypothetical protein CBB77_00805 [Hyphomonas sp. TMED17]CAI8398652.1 MAG: Uncharacterised protein [Hyphomonas sp. TMED17]